MKSSMETGNTEKKKKKPSGELRVHGLPERSCLVDR